MVVITLIVSRVYVFDFIDIENFDDMICDIPIPTSAIANGMSMPCKTKWSCLDRNG